MILKINSNYFLKWHPFFLFRDGETVGSLWGLNWTFVYNVDELQVGRCRPLTEEAHGWSWSGQCDVCSRSDNGTLFSSEYISFLFSVSFDQYPTFISISTVPQFCRVIPTDYIYLTIIYGKIIYHRFKRLTTYINVPSLPYFSKSKSQFFTYIFSEIPHYSVTHRCQTILRKCTVNCS